MANPVYIDFIVRGIPDVTRAFKTVQDAAIAAERAQTARARNESTQRQRLADQEARAKVRAVEQAAKAEKRAQESATREAEKAARQKLRAEEKAARELARIAENAERARQREAERAERNIQRIRERSATMAGRYYARLAEMERRANFVRERDEFRNRRRFASHIGASAIGSFEAAAGRVGRLTMQTAGLVGQLGGGFSIADSVQRNAKNAGETAELINAAVNPLSANRANRQRRDRREVEGVIDTATIGFGIERSQAIEGLREFSAKTGDFDTALKLLPKLAELSRATGTELSDMAAAAGQVGMGFENITDGEEKMRKIMQVMRVIAGQGKAGTVEIKDMAVQMAKLVATANKFEGDNVENLARMGMLSQFAAGGGGAWSASSAATSVTSFGAVFSKPSRLKAFEEKGIEVFTDKSHTKLRAPEEIIADAFEKTKGDQAEVAKLFGSAMAIRAVNKFGEAYSGGYETVNGEKLTGRAAVVGMARDLTRTQMSEKEVTESAALRMQEMDARMAAVQENFDKAVREKIIPALLDLIPEFERLVPQLVELNQKAIPSFIELFKTIAKFAEAHKGEIDFLASHPIAAILAAEVGKQVAMAGIAELLKVGISKAFGDAGLGAVFSRVLSSQLGQAGLIVGAAAIAIQQGMIAIDNEYKKTDDLRQGARNDEIQATQLLKRIQNGTATEKDRQDAQQLVGKLSQDIDAVANDANNPGFWKRAGRGLANIFMPEEAAEAERSEKAAVQSQIDEMTKTMRQLEAALRENTGATRANTTGSGGSGPNGAARSGSIVQRNGVK